MSMFGAIDASASGLTAERLRLDVISNNIANVNTTRTAEGGPYRRQMVVFQPRSDGSSFTQILAHQLDAGSGVRVVGIVKDNSPFKKVYDPKHPDANSDGYTNIEDFINGLDPRAAAVDWTDLKNNRDPRG